MPPGCSSLRCFLGSCRSAIVSLSTTDCVVAVCTAVSLCTLDSITDSSVMLAQVVRKVLNMLLALIRALSKMNEPSGSDLDSWESLVFHCRTLEASTNDLVAGVGWPCGMSRQQWHALANFYKSPESAPAPSVELCHQRRVACADLYGPQDTASVASATQAVLTGAELILEELPGSMPEAQKRVLRHAGQTLSSAHGSHAAAQS